MSAHLYTPRISATPWSTTGLLVVDDVQWKAVTLEDRPRLEKVPGETCIPPGTYTLGKRWSPRFGRYMLWIMRVPGFEYVYNHAGNMAKETDGCVLVAAERTTLDKILGRSRDLERDLFAYVDGRCAIGWSKKDPAGKVLEAGYIGASWTFHNGPMVEKFLKENP